MREGRDAAANAIKGIESFLCGNPLIQHAVLNAIKTSPAKQRQAFSLEKQEPSSSPAKGEGGRVFIALGYPLSCSLSIPSNLCFPYFLQVASSHIYPRRFASLAFFQIPRRFYAEV